MTTIVIASPPASRGTRRRAAVRTLALLAAAGAILLGGSRGTQDAVANGDTRSLKFYNTHTRENLDVTFKRNGRYDEDALKQLNWFLRDWRRDEQVKMDPRLFDVIWEVYKDVDASSAVNVVCGYRAPETNEMLRNRSRRSGVAQHSQHTLGKALDFYIPGVPVSAVREAGIRLQRGGVGYYPTSGSPFVHLDVGNIRAWPRMTREQLSKIFPDGKTVHLPSNGGPLPGYSVALAEIRERGATVNQRFDFASAGSQSSSPKQKSFLARLLTREDEDEAAETAGAAEAAPALASRSRVAAYSRPEKAEPAPAAAPALLAKVPLPVARPAEIMVAAAQTAPVAAPAAAPPSVAAGPAAAPSAGPVMVWKQGPQALAYASASAGVPWPTETPAAIPASAAAAPAPASDGPVAPLPRAKPAAIGGPKAEPAAPVQVAAMGATVPVLAGAAMRAPAPAGNPDFFLANRIAAAALQSPPRSRTVPGAAAQPVTASAGSGANPIFALANRIARAGGAEPAITGSTGRGDLGGLRLPENFAERSSPAFRNRIALAYSDESAGARPGARFRSLPPITFRQPVSTPLISARLDERSWRIAIVRERLVRLSGALEKARAEDAGDLLVAPIRTLPFGFRDDPAYGASTEHFTGATVMFIRTVYVGPAGQFAAR